jgi:hypothetical protein
VSPPGPPPACGLLLLGAPVMPVPRPLSLGVVLCPEVAAPELSLPRGIWLWAEATPLETNNAAAANMAEYFLISSFLSFSLLCAAVQRRAAAGVPRCFVAARAQSPAVPRHVETRNVAFAGSERGDTNNKGKNRRSSIVNAGAPLAHRSDGPGRRLGPSPIRQRAQAPVRQELQTNAGLGVHPSPASVQRSWVGVLTPRSPASWPRSSAAGRAG